MAQLRAFPNGLQRGIVQHDIPTIPTADNLHNKAQQCHHKRIIPVAIMPTTKGTGLPEIMPFQGDSANAS